MGSGESTELVDEAEAVAHKLEFSDEPRQISSDTTLWADAAVRAGDLKDLVGSEGSARFAFARLWPICLPSEEGLAARVRICEVLQCTVRLHGPKRSMEVGRQLALTFGGSSLPVSFEEAFKLARSALSSIQDPPNNTTASSSLSRSALHLPSTSILSTGLGRGVTPVDVAVPLRRAPQDRNSHRSTTTPRHMILPAMLDETQPETFGRQDPTRAILESLHARLSGRLNGFAVKQQQAAARVKELRSLLATATTPSTDPSTPGVSQNHAHVAPLANHLATQKAKIEILAQECQLWTSEVALQTSEKERYQVELEYTVQDIDDLQRQLLAEQLRVAMLRDAYEGEQPSLGSSLETVGERMVQADWSTQELQDFDQAE